MAKYVIITSTIIFIILIIILICLLTPRQSVLVEIPDNIGDIIPINDSINLIYIKNFLSPEECQHIINNFKDKVFRSKVISNTNNSVESDYRTSYSYYIPKSHDDIIQRIEQRINKFLQHHVENKDWINNLEPLQMVKYEPGQEFKEHHDWFGQDYIKSINDSQRQFTFFIYLNDVPYGGETEFTKLKLSFKPKCGGALFWKNCYDENNCIDETMHCGKPPIIGTKYGLNVWVKFK